MLDKLRDEWFRSPTLAENPTRWPILTGMDGALPQSGPLLANPPGVQSLDQAEQWYRARATAAYMSAMRGKLAWLIALDVFIIAVLALVGPSPEFVLRSKSGKQLGAICTRNECPARIRAAEWPRSTFRT